MFGAASHNPAGRADALPLAVQALYARARKMLFPAIMNGADMTDSKMVSVTSCDHSGLVSPVGPSLGK